MSFDTHRADETYRRERAPHMEEDVLTLLRWRFAVAAALTSMLIIRRQLLLARLHLLSADSIMQQEPSRENHQNNASLR
jgi:hypothetical protein